ncbi:hypothetical protein O181_069375 [Austropuccinia psidii MF-1]|uniref:Integrase catalytic domain-containing protein n=1 Tax=Austropuccinia psidii MF-1 TaxID=1389203 RepID=A0A9Q3I812_9BASI|nr:hypothetical protein [Austropuccinia psidii MF-1]
MNIKQNNTLVHTTRVNLHLFIPFFYPSSPAAINCISDSIPPPQINLSTRPAHHIAHNMRKLWHQRLGHLSIRNIKQIMQFKAADHIHQPGEVIEADLIGPLPVSNDGKQYALVIQDIFSRLTEIIALTDKSDAKHQLRLWMIKLMNITEFTILVVRTYNGAEFCNHFFNYYLKEKGIIHELSVPYEHHQKGKIERTNHTISEIAKASLIAANLPTSLCAYAFRHAAWIFNRTLQSDSKITPYEIVGSRKPSLFQLKVFGVKAFIFNHQAKKDLGAKTIIGYHLGIMEDSKVSEIQVDDLFDGSMIRQLNKQDSFISVLNSSNDPTAALPMTYNGAMSSLQAEEWKKAMLEKLNSMT